MVKIRPEQPADIPAVRSVHEAAFPDRGRGEPRREAARERQGRVSLVARGRRPHRRAHPVQPRHVRPAGRRHRVRARPDGRVCRATRSTASGRRLVQNGLAECHAQGACLVVVLGDPGYYGRFGFERASRHGLRNEFGVEEDFMVFMLDAGAHPTPATMVKYAPEFDGLAPAR